MKRKIKFIASVLAAVLCSLFIFADNVEAADFIDGLPNVALNGSFEDRDQDAGVGPWHWESLGGFGGTYVKWNDDAEYVHSGEKSVHIYNEDSTKNPHVRQKVYLTPGAEYQYALWYKEGPKLNELNPTRDSSIGYFELKLEWFAYDENGTRTHYSEARPVKVRETVDGWKQLVYNFTMPPEAQFVYIYGRAIKLGDFYIDDVTLCNIGAAESMNISPDEVFYYSDYTGTSSAQIKFNTSAVPALADVTTVSATLKKGDEVISGPTELAVTDNQATYTYDVALLTEKQVEYTIEATATTADGTVHTGSTYIYKYDRPQFLGADGIYRNKDGEIIQPVMAYKYRSSEGHWDIGSAKKINVAQLAMPSDLNGQDLVDYLKGQLDLAQEKGMMCMIALYRNMKPAGDDINVETTKLVVSSLKDHPAVFAWMVMDETYNTIANPEDVLRRSYIAIRNNDPYHPVYMCEATTKMREAGRYCDILTVDPYPASHSAPETFPATRVSMAVEQVTQSKAIYSLLQAFDWQGYMPTGDELRNMIYQSFLAGAKGFGYYMFADSQDGKDLNDTHLWPYISDFAEKEQDDVYKAFVFGEYPIFSSDKNDNFWAVSYEKNNKVHLVVLNRKDVEQEVTVNLTSTDGTETIGDYNATCIAGNGEATGATITGNGTLSATIVKSGAAVFEISTDTAVAEGYTAGISAESLNVEVGGVVKIPVAVSHDTETAFNACEIKVSYDSNVLTFNEEKSTLGTNVGTSTAEGVLTLEDYGADKACGNSVYVLAFDAIKAAANSEVELTYAAFNNDKNAANEDLEVAAALNPASVVLNIAEASLSVEIDSDMFTGNATVAYGDDYTFSLAENGEYYDYTSISATMGGEATTVLDNNNGTYTIENVTGALVITAERNPKIFDVTFEGTGGADAEAVEGNVASAKYLTDYTFTMPEDTTENYYTFDSITIGGVAYTDYSVNKGVYTIKGVDVKGKIVVNITKTAMSEDTVKVTIEGTGAGVASGEVTIKKGEAYTLTLTPEAGYLYEVTATMGGEKATVVDNKDNTYTINDVDGAIVFTVNHSVDTSGVSVSAEPYVNVDGLVVWLVTNSTAVADGKVPTYDGEKMFWSERYNNGLGAYCYLVVAETLSEEDAKAKLDISSGTKTTVGYDMDVNMTGTVDASDAQLTYNIYNAMYDGFTVDVTVEKFLRADVNADAKINVNDAAAIVTYILNPAATN